MNEQLIVKNFGPIKDATVDFKKVTVFIGPTGGGKSTLAKLAAIFRDENYNSIDNYNLSDNKHLVDYSMQSYVKFDSVVTSKKDLVSKKISSDRKSISIKIDDLLLDNLDLTLNNSNKLVDEADVLLDEIKATNDENKLKLLYLEIESLIKLAREGHEVVKRKRTNIMYASRPIYIPSERGFVSSIEYSWAGLIRDGIGLPKPLLNFANSFSTSRKDVSELPIKFFNVIYQHVNGRDFIKIPELEEPLMLLETASGIQSVTPMLVLLEHLLQQKDQAQSFIIEEPELNLYPTAQQGLMNWLIEKCTVGENDLTITTHSPYILSHLNLLLYAYQVAEKHPDRANDVAKVVPRESWINPKEFACYQVENGGVQSLVNEELGLIDDNELDNLSGDAADAFDNLIRLSKSVAVK
jgi:predicted ATPase